MGYPETIKQLAMLLSALDRLMETFSTKLEKVIVLTKLLISEQRN